MNAKNRVVIVGAGLAEKLGNVMRGEPAKSCSTCTAGKGARQRSITCGHKRSLVQSLQAAAAA